MSFHSVFGSAPPPGDYAYYSDGNPSIVLGQTFYEFGLPAGSKIVRGRKWIPAGVGGGTATCYLFLGVKTGVNNLDTTPVQTKSVTWSGDAKWVEAIFDVPQTPPAGDARWMIAWQHSDPFRYVSSLNFRADPGLVFNALDGAPFALSEHLDNGLNGPVRDRYLRFGTDAVIAPGSTEGGYGIDTVIEIPDGPGNIGPVALAGADQIVEEGDIVSLAGGGTDADGTITGYLWQQTAGAAVVLGGSGQNRTFGAPAGPAVLTFRLTVTDDQGAIGQDSMTVTVLEGVDPEPPTTSDYELDLNRRNTAAFIAADPIDVALVRSTKVDKGDGGHKYTPGAPITSQTFRLIPQTDVMPQVMTPDGVQLTPTYVLLGEWDSDIQRWDRFSLNGVEFQVVSPVRPDFRTSGVYEKKADVARR